MKFPKKLLVSKILEQTILIYIKKKTKTYYQFDFKQFNIEYVINRNKINIKLFIIKIKFAIINCKFSFYYGDMDRITINNLKNYKINFI